MSCQTRSDELASHGYRAVRFWNAEVPANLDGVLDMILDHQHPG